jgi:hypothetical protein
MLIGPIGVPMSMSMGGGAVVTSTGWVGVSLVSEDEAGGCPTTVFA